MQCLCKGTHWIGSAKRLNSGILGGDGFGDDSSRWSEGESGVTTKVVTVKGVPAEFVCTTYKNEYGTWRISSLRFACDGMTVGLCTV